MRVRLWPVEGSCACRALGESLQQGDTGHMGQDNCFQAKQPNHCPARIKAQTKEQLPLPSVLRATGARGSVAPCLRTNYSPGQRGCHSLSPTLIPSLCSTGRSGQGASAERDRKAGADLGRCCLPGPPDRGEVHGDTSQPSRDGQQGWHCRVGCTHPSQQVLGEELTQSCWAIPDPGSSIHHLGASQQLTLASANTSINSLIDPSGSGY